MQESILSFWRWLSCHFSMGIGEYFMNAITLAVLGLKGRDHAEWLFYYANSFNYFSTYSAGGSQKTSRHTELTNEKNPTVAFLWNPTVLDLKVAAGGQWGENRFWDRSTTPTQCDRIYEPEQSPAGRWPDVLRSKAQVSKVLNDLQLSVPLHAEPEECLCFIHDQDPQSDPRGRDGWRAYSCDHELIFYC